MAKVSVVLPIYNVEKYLKKCLDSIINQTFKDIEIICVNDGSTDNSPQILEEYAAKDNRIKIVNKQNGGLASARNAGFKEASGEYLIFIDSDDYIELNCIEKAYNIAISKNADVVCFNHFIHTKTGIEQYWTKKILTEFENKELDYKNKNDLCIYPWDKLFKLSFLKENTLSFAEEMKMNDNAFAFQLSMIENAVWACCPDDLYHYIYYRAGSLTTNGKKVIDEDITAIKYIVNLKEFKNAADEQKIINIQKLIFGLMGHFYRKENKKYRFLFVKQLNELRKFLFKEIDENLLNQCENIDFIKTANPVFYITSQIFSIQKTFGDKKVPHFKITILGICFNIKLGSKNA